MTEAELRHAVGDRVYDAFAPHGLLYNHDAEDPDDLVFLGTTDKARRSRSTSGPPRATSSSTSTSTSSRWTAAGSPPPPACPATPRCATTTTSTPCSTAKSFMDQHAQRAALVELAHGQGPARRRRQGLPDRDDDQQRRVRHRRPDERAAEARVGVEPDDRATFLGDAGRPRPHAGPRQAQDLPGLAGAPRADLGAGRRGRGRAQGHHRERVQPAPRAGRGPDRHPDDGPALHLPVQRELDHEPDPRDVPRARLLLQPLPGPARRCARAACSS